MKRETMTSKETADYIGISISTLRKYVHEEGLPVLRFPGRKKWLFREDLIDDWIEERSQPEIVVMTNNESSKEYGSLRVLAP